jgi:LytS/YehU family sensor histidine kinase
MNCGVKALKSQMNPPFIYNALNIIQALVVNDKKEEAVFYIGIFSRLLRQGLKQSENNVISLEKELETLRHYISLESLRLNMQPKYDLKIDSRLDMASEKIPPPYPTTLC